MRRMRHLRRNGDLSHNTVSIIEFLAADLRRRLERAAAEESGERAVCTPPDPPPPAQYEPISIAGERACTSPADPPPPAQYEPISIAGELGDGPVGFRKWGIVRVRKPKVIKQ